MYHNILKPEEINLTFTIQLVELPLRPGIKLVHEPAMSGTAP